MNTPNIQELAQKAESLLDARRLGEAQTLYERITELDPAHADAWFMLGVIHGDSGQPAAGIACLERALQLDNELLDAHLNLGNLLFRQGNFDAAIEHVRTATILDPAYMEAWLLLGNIHNQIGNNRDAIPCIENAIELMPDAAESRIALAMSLYQVGFSDYAVKLLQKPLNTLPRGPGLLASLGNTLQSFRRSEDAEKVYRHLALVAPRDIRGHNGLTEACLSQGKLRQAEESCIAALKVDDANVQSLANLGTILQAKGNLEGARAMLQRAVELAPENAVVQYKFSSVMLALGDAEKAKQHCRKAIELRPDFVDGQSALASIYEQEGDFDQAWSILRKLIDGGNRSPHILMALANLAHRYDEIPGTIRLLEELVAGNRLAPVTRAQIYHQLGKLYNRSGDYNSAFLNQQQSNRLKESSFDPQVHTEKISSTISVFDREFIHTGPRAGNCSELPVFIIGMPRSGTTLVEQIIASHPLVHGAGELLDIIKIASTLCVDTKARDAYPMCLREISPQRLDVIANRYLFRLSSMKAHAIRVTDKMPHNFLHLGLIQMLFPSAHVIHTVRNPLDTCVSIYFEEFSNWHSYAYDLDHLAAYYKEYERLMKHWEQVIEHPILKVPYEKLINDQDGWSRRMIEFIGLEWNDQCLRFFENKRLVATPSYDQVRQPLYTHSVERWRNYEQHLDVLKRVFYIND